MRDREGRFFFREVFEPGRGWVTYKVRYDEPKTAEGAAPTTPVPPSPKGAA